MTDLTKFRIVSLIALLFFGGWLIFGGSPSESGIAAAEAAGKKVKVEHFVTSGLFTGAIAGAAISLVALLAAPLLCRRGELYEDTRPVYPPSMRNFVIVAGVITIVVTAITNHHRLSQSLWDDEEKAMRMFIVGKVYQSSKTGEWKFKEASWQDTFFNYRLPNNHILFSAAAKLCHIGHDTQPTEPDAMYFNEWRLRLPSFIAGLASIGLVGWLVTLLGFQRAAVFAMPLTAMHPWFLRYLVEARGYAMVMMFTLLATVFLVRALQSGRWRWWLALGAAEFALLWTYPVAVYIALTLHGCGALVVWFSPRFAGVRQVMTGRLVTAGLAMSALIVFVMSPTIPQLQAYLAEDRDLQSLTPKLAIDSVSLFLSGCHWHVWDVSNPLAFGLKGLLDESPILFTLCAGVLGAALIAGAVRLIKKQSIAWIVLPIFLAPPAVFLAQAAIQQTAFYPWYIIGTLPIVPILLALGADYAVRPLGTKRIGGLAAILSATAVIVLFNTINHRQRSITTSHPIEPKRDSFHLYRPTTTNPFHPAINNILTIGFHQENNTYDPKMSRLDDVDQQHLIHDVIDEAIRTGKPLFVDFAQEPYARVHFTEIFDVLDDPSRFEVVAELPGLEPQNTRKVMRFIGYPEPTTAPIRQPTP